MSRRRLDNNNDDAAADVRCCNPRHRMMLRSFSSASHFALVVVYLPLLLLLLLVGSHIQHAHAGSLCTFGVGTQGVYDVTCTNALFGIQPVRSAATGVVIDAGGGTGVNASYGCSAFNVANNPAWLAAVADWSNPLPVILIVDRGNCPFVLKVSNAQSATSADGLLRGNVVAVVVVNSDSNLPLPYMHADGSTSGISLPSVLITKGEGVNLRGKLSPTGASKYYGSLEFFLPNPDDRVEYDLVAPVTFDSSKNSDGTWKDGSFDRFRASFYTVASTLGASVAYTPYPRLVRGCPLPSGCENMCTNNEQYCMPLPLPTTTTLRPEQRYLVVQETIRQYALFQVISSAAYNNNPKVSNGLGMFAYYYAFYQMSGDCKYSYTEDCSYRAMTIMLGSDIVSQVKTLVGDYGRTSTASNLVAESLLTALGSYAPVGTSVSLYVNRAVVSTSPSCPLPIRQYDCGLVQYICDGFAAGTAPAACGYDATCPFGQQRDGCGECNGSNSCSSISLGVVVAVALIAMLVVGGIVYVYMRRQQQRTKSDIDLLLKQYLPDSEGLGSASSARDIQKKQERRLIELHEADFSASDEV